MSNERENLSEAFYQDLLLLQAPVEKDISFLQQSFRATQKKNPKHCHAKKFF